MGEGRRRKRRQKKGHTCGGGPNPKAKRSEGFSHDQGWLLSVQKDASLYKIIHNRAVSIAGFSQMFNGFSHKAPLS